MNGSKRMPSGSMSPVGVLAIVMLVVTSLVSQHQCSPSASRPNLDEIEVKNVADKMGQVVANLAGHLELLGDTTTSLSLNINAISNAMFDTDHSKHIVTMTDDHVLLSISYHTIDGGSSYEFTSIEMCVNNGTEQVGAYTGICEFDEQFVFSLPVDLRYSCQKKLSHSCSKNGERVANLVLESFELELDGDKAKIAKGEFSKTTWRESCDHWSGSELSTAYWGWCIVILIIIIIIIIMTIMIRRRGGVPNCF